MRRPLLLLLAVLTPVTGGCWSAPRPGRVVEYWPGQSANTAAVPFTADYTLYRVTTPAGGLDAVHQVRVEQDRNLGFIRRYDGSLAAYASGQTVALEEGHYRWQPSPETAKSGKEVAREEMAEARRTAGTVAVLLAAASAFLAGAFFLGSVGSSGK